VFSDLKDPKETLQDTISVVQGLPAIDLMVYNATLGDPGMSICPDSDEKDLIDGLRISKMLTIVD
jgi:hypothetical protein